VLTRAMRRFALAGALLGAGLTATGCSNRSVPAPEPIVSVQVATLHPQPIERQVTGEAVLYANNQATIIPKISAPIRKFYVQRGSRVRAGELLAELENKDLAAAVAENQGALKEAQASYATSTQVNLPAQIQAAQLDVQNTEQAMKANELVYQSRRKLYQAGAIARNLLDQSQVAFIQSRNQYEIALARLKSLQAVGKTQQLKSAQGQLAAARGRYLAARAQLEYSEVRSPMDGVVTDRPLYEGEMATAGSPLITVMDISRVVARLHLPPEQAHWLRVGDRASVSEGQEAVAGKVILVSPALDPESTTVQVWVEVPNPQGKLLVGSTAQVSMVAQKVADALVVPAAAVLTADDGSTSVMVVASDDIARQTSVETGIRQGDEVQITRGLKPGEKVVTAGAYGLPDGTRVKY
jgi:HlyD family secretion protein